MAEHSRWAASQLPEARLLVGGVIARAGLADSADAVIVSARADRKSDDWLLRIEAIMRILAGQTDQALDLLEEFRALRPDYSFDHEGELHWFWHPIADHPRFVALQARPPGR